MAGSTFDAGSIEARLTLDRSDFTDDLRAAKAEVADFERQRHQIKFTADTSAAMRDVALMKADLASLRDVRLNVSVSGSTAQIRAIQQSAGAVDGRKIKMSVGLDGAATVQRQLLNIQRRADLLDGKTINIRTDVDTAGAMTQIAALRASLNGLNNTTTTTTVRTGGLGDAFKGSVGGMQDMLAVALLLGPALVPIAAGALAVGGGLVSMAVAGGAAAGIFGGALMGAVKQVTALDKQLTAAKSNLADQKAALDKLTPGTKAYGLQLEKVEQAQQAVNKATAAYTPQQRQFSNAITGMKSAWSGFVKSTSSTTLPIASTFVGALTTALPKLTPVVKAVAPVVNSVAVAFKGWVASGLDTWVSWISTNGVPILKDFVGTGRNLAGVFGDMLRAFTPLGRSLADGLKKSSDALAGWSTGGGFQNFLAYVQSNGPALKQFFGALGQALANIGRALKDMGPFALSTTTVLLRLLGAMSPGQVQAFAYAFIAVRAAMLVYSVYTAAATAATWLFSTAQGASRVQMAGLRLQLAAIWVQQKLMAAWTGIVTAAQWAWNAAMTANPIGLIIVGIAALVAAVVLIATKTTWFQTAWKYTWNAVKAVAMAIWNTQLKPILHGFEAALHAVGTAGKWLWSNALSPAFHSIGDLARWLYSNVVKPQFDLMVAAFKLVGRWGSWLWDNALKPAWDLIKSGTGKLKDSMVKTFTAMRDGIGKVWDGLKKVAAAPINFVIGTVYNDGIRKVWNKIAGAVGLSKLDLPAVSTVKFRHGGPVTGGAPGVDSVPAMMMPGEHVWTADEVRNAGGHGAMAQMRAMFASQGRSRLGAVNTSPKTGGGAYRFKDGGGFLGTGVGPSVGSIVDKAKSVGGSVLGGLKDLTRGAMASVINPLLNTIASKAQSGVKAVIPGSPPWESLVAGVATAPLKWIKDFVAKDDKKYGASIGGKIPAGQHKAVIDAALAAAHIPPPGTLGQWEAGMNTLITRESGWNAGAINRWDSNAKAGHPSQGLAQTIPGTFNAYVPKSLKHLGILNPIANVAAAARYIVARYGNITRVQQANANKPPQGYATGGVMTQGLHLVGEKGPELVASSGNDRVYTYAETMKMMKASNGSGGGEMTGTMTLSGDVTLKVGDQEFTAYLDGQARQTLNDVVNQAAGSR